MPLRFSPAVPAGRLGPGEQPRIPGTGVVLRPWRAEDADVLVGAYQDPDIRRWHARTMTRDEALEWIASWPGRWDSGTGADWSVADAADRVLGRIGLRHLELIDGVGEVAYWVLPGARGRGVATEALDTLARWAFGTGLHRLQLVHSTANEPSCRVALKAGFLPEGVLRGQALHEDGRHDMHLHARLAGDRPSD